MEFEMSRGAIKLDKELNDLDELLIDFVKALDRNKTKYVVVSGYVSILFGRSRSSEDIDIIVENIAEKKFATIWNALAKQNFHCIVPGNAESAYEYLAGRTSIRFARKDDPLPNIEFMFPKNEDVDGWTLKHALQVRLNGNVIRISPIELQIAYKLFLGSNKDIEDARHLYKIFETKLDPKLLTAFLLKLDKKGRFNKYLA